MSALEINRLDKIARRFKRVGGAIADLWGGQYLCFVYYVVVWRKVFLPRKKFIPWRLFEQILGPLFGSEPDGGACFGPCVVATAHAAVVDTARHTGMRWLICTCRRAFGATPPWPQKPPPPPTLPPTWALYTPIHPPGLFTCLLPISLSAARA